jgi:hypothetical protein
MGLITVSAFGKYPCQCLSDIFPRFHVRHDRGHHVLPDSRYSGRIRSGPGFRIRTTAKRNQCLPDGGQLSARKFPVARVGEFYGRVLHCTPRLSLVGGNADAMATARHQYSAKYQDRVEHDQTGTDFGETHGVHSMGL